MLNKDTLVVKTKTKLAEEELECERLKNYLKNK